MKAKAKSLWVWLCGIVAALCLITGVWAGTPKFEAFASGETPTVTMEAGASIRKTAGESGIKFTAKIDNYNSSYQYGMLILPESAWAKCGWDNNTDYFDYFSDNSITNYANTICTPYKDKETGEWKISYSLKNIYADNYAMGFVGVAYTKNGSSYDYADVDMVTNARSIAYVAQMALKYETGLTVAQKEALKTYTQAGVIVDKNEYLGDGTLGTGGSTNATQSNWVAEYTFNEGGEVVPFITKNAYAAGTSISFDYYIPSGTVTSWWGVGYAEDVSSIDYYAAAENGISVTLGAWTTHTFTLPSSGGPYYVYISSEVGGSAGRWMLGDKNAYAYLDNFTIGSDTEKFSANANAWILDVNSPSVFKAYEYQKAEISFGESAMLGEYAMKYIFNASGETVSQVTKEAYAAGSEVSFKYYIPEGTSTQWWGLAYSETNTGLDIYAAADSSKAKTLQAVTGAWTDVSFTLPTSGGPYYLYFGSEVGNWKLNGENAYVLIDEFTVNGNTEDFNNGVQNSIFSVLVADTVVNSENGEGYVEDATDYMLAFDEASIGGNERIAMVTADTYKGVTEISFKAMYLATAVSPYWGLSYTTDPTQFSYDDNNLAAVNCYTPKFGNLKTDAGVIYNYKLTISGNTWTMYADDTSIASGSYTDGENYFYFVVNPKQGTDTAFYMDDFSITYDGGTVTDTFKNAQSSLFVESATVIGTGYGSTGMSFLASTFVEQEGGEVEELGEVAMKFFFNNGDDGVRARTTNAYAGGSTVEFRYYIQADTAVQWTRFIWDTDTTCDNYAETYTSFGNTAGEWVLWSYTLPSGGPYYLYFGFECGNWGDSSGAPYILFDDFTVNDEVETFNYGVENSAFTILNSNLAGNSAVGEGYTPPAPEPLGAKLTIDLLSSTASTPSFITASAYTLTEETTVTLDYYMSGNTNSKWWAFFWTNSNTVASIYAHVESNKTNNDGRDLPTGVQDAWATATVTVPAGTWYFYIAGAVGEWSGGSVIVDNIQIGDVVSENFNQGLGIFLDNRSSKPDAIVLADGKPDFVPGNYAAQFDFSNSFDNKATSFMTKESVAKGGDIVSFKYYIPDTTTVGDWWSLNWHTSNSGNFWGVGNGAAVGDGGVDLGKTKGAWTNVYITIPTDTQGNTYYLYFCGYQNWSGYVYIDEFKVIRDGATVASEDFTNGVAGSIFNVNSSYVHNSALDGGYVDAVNGEYGAKISLTSISGTVNTPSFISAYPFAGGGTVTFDYYMYNPNNQWWTFAWTTSNTNANIYVGADASASTETNDACVLPINVAETWTSVTVDIPAGYNWYFYIGAAKGSWGDGYVILDNITVKNANGDVVAIETFNHGFDIFLNNRTSCISLADGYVAEVVEDEESGDAYALENLLKNETTLQDVMANGGYASLISNVEISVENLPSSMVFLEGSFKYTITGEKEFAISLGNNHFIAITADSVCLYNGVNKLGEIAFVSGETENTLYLALTAGGKVIVKLNSGEYVGLGVMEAAPAFVKLIALGGSGSVAFSSILIEWYKATALPENMPYYFSEETIDFTAYAFDSKTMVSEEGFQLLADAGFTKTLALLEGRMNDGTDLHEQVIRDNENCSCGSAEAHVKNLMDEVNADAMAALELAEKFGLKHYVFNSNIYNIERDPANYEWFDEFADLATYKLSNAFAGHFLADEPSWSEKTESFKKVFDSSTGEIVELVNAYKAYKKVFPNSEAYINLLPKYEWVSSNYFESNNQVYKDYIQYYIDNIGKDLGYVSVDIYPLECEWNSDKSAYSSTSINEMHLWNLEYIAQKCRDNNIEMRIYIKAAHTADEATKRSTESINDLYFQIYSALAYGTKEIVYYQFTAHTDNGDAVFNGNSLTPLGSVYDWTKQANNEVLAFSAAYMNFDWKSASFYGASTTQSSHITSAGAYGYLSSASTTSGSVLVGNFARKATTAAQYGDDYAYMVVNYGNPGASTAESSITLTFNGTPTRVLVYENGTPEIYTLTNNAVTLNLEVGEGAFVIPLAA